MADHFVAWAPFVFMALLALVFMVLFVVALFQRDEADNTLRLVRHAAWTENFTLTPERRLEWIRMALREGKR